MAEVFSPYRQWLELDIDQPANDYELLGLAPGEASASVIAAAADRAIARVRSHRPGDQAASWSRLLDQLTSAKRRLLDPAEKARYDEQLGSGTLSTASAEAPAPMPTASSPLQPDTLTSPAPGPSAAPAPWAMAATPPWQQAQAPAAPMQPMPMAYAMPMQPGMMPGYPAGGPMAPPGWYGPMQAPMPAAPPPPPAEPQNWGGPMGGATTNLGPMAPTMPPGGVDPMAPIDPMAPVGQVAALAAPAGTAFAVGETAAALPMGTAVGSVSAEPTNAEGPVAKVAGQSPARAAAARSRSNAFGPMLWGGGCVGAVLVAVIVWAANENGSNERPLAENSAPRKGITRREKPPVARPAQPIDSKPAPRPLPPEIKKETDPPTTAMKPPADVDPAPKPDLMPMPADPQMADPAPKPQEPMPDPTPPKPPEPTPPPMPETPLPSKEEVAKLQSALATARIALSEGNVEEANSQLASVDQLPKLPEHDAMYDRMKMLADYNGQFWDAVKEGTKSFESGSDLEVGSTVISVVEVLPDDKIILRINGRNQTFPFKDLKAGIAMAIADQWFKPNDPTALVMKGAYAAVNKAGNIERAKEWWGQAIDQGVDVKSLLPVIDDKYESFEQDLDKAMKAREAK